MKKTLALILALLMITALFAACGQKPAATDTPPAADTPAADTPAEPAADAPASGGKGLVVAIAPTLEAEGLRIILENWKKAMEEDGFEAVLTSADADNAKYIALIEDYTARGAKLLMVAAIDAEAIGDACKAAMDAGVFVTMLGIQPDSYQIDGGLITDYRKTGDACAEMAIYWIEHNLDITKGDDSIPVAVNIYSENTNGVNRSNGFVEGINSYGPTFVAYTEDIYSSTEDGYNFAETALTRDPSIRVFICYEPDTAVGVNNYLMQAGVNVSEYAVFCVYQTEAAMAEIDKTKTDPAASAMRGLINYGGTLEETGYLLASTGRGLLAGAHPSPFWAYDSIHTYNTFGFEYSYTFEG